LLRGKKVTLDTIITIIALGMALYHLASTQHLFVLPIQQQSIHLAFAVALVFLTSMRKGSRIRRVFSAGFILFCLLSIGYINFFFYELVDRSMFNTTTDLVVGMTLIVITIEASRRAFGLVFPILTSIIVAYAFLGQYLPQPLTAMALPWEKIVSRLSIGMSGGIFSSALRASVNFIFLFLLFGGILHASGASQFFIMVGRLVGKRIRGGPAMTAVVSSALMGMVVGSPTANVGITGTFTIPLMKKVGYRPEQAGAIEAAASTGGQIMPPVMGVAAFLMSDLIGVPYVDIMIAGAIPAILYFLAVGGYVQLNAIKLNIPKATEELNFKELWFNGLTFFVPLFALVFLLLRRNTPAFAAFWAIVSVIVVSLIMNKIQGRKFSLSSWIQGFVNGAVVGSQIAVTCACLGIVMAVLVFTGLGITIPAAVEALSGGNLLVALIIAFGIAIILGCGLPTAVAYILVGIVVAPVLVRMGVPLLHAHFFAFFACVFAFCTPPMAMAALVASGIAGAPFFTTALESTKVAIVGLMLPFLAVFCPVILLQPTSPMVATTGLIAFILGTLALIIALNNYFLSALNKWERTLCFACAGAFLGYIVVQNYTLLAIAAVLLVLETIWQLRKRKGG